jgi:HSP20 family protein
VDKDTLVIEGRAGLVTADAMQPLHVELRNRNYRCAFALSGELDCDAIEAQLRDGVLKVRIPKRSELLPRRIEIKVA